jgi:hypothetical protein
MKVTGTNHVHVALLQESTCNLHGFGTNPKKAKSAAPRSK